MNKILPILSGSLAEVIASIFNKTADPIAKEILLINTVVQDFNTMCYNISDTTCNEILDNLINSRITDEVRMISVRLGEFEVSFLPKGKDPEYGPRNTWSRKNRQTGKPARIFQKLLKTEFKTRDWEIFSNLFKAELCQCANFQLVEGEDIRYWYYDEHYYLCDGTLGNSCMRYSHTQPFFDVYVENAKMLITTKNGLLTGRAIVWEIDGITILDRIYTCFDYLENCFIDYAKERGWWIRENNSLLSTGDEQTWLTPEDNYESVHYKVFHITLKSKYCYFPYMDSFRYYDGDKTLSTGPEYNYALDSTDGEIRGEEYTCDNCGSTFFGYDDEVPDGLHYSNYSDAYYCDDCCWYSDGLDDYIPNSDPSIIVHGKWNSALYPQSYLDDNLVTTPNGEESSDNIVKIDNKYYFVTTNLIFNQETNKYEIRLNTN
jgi:hypothetical protein